MKIVINARFLTQPLSGVQRYGIECSRQIKKLYHEAIFLCPPDILNHDIADELGAKVIGKNTGHLWEQFDLPRYLAKMKNPPLLNLANTAPVWYPNNYVTIHDLAFYYHPEWNSKMFSMWYNILIPRLAYKSRHIFTVSETIKSEIAKCYNVPGNKITVTYNGVSQAMLSSAKPAPSKKERIILSVGSFNLRKNHQRLVDAFVGSDIKKSYQLVIIGDKNKVFSESGLDETKLTDNNIKICQDFDENALIDMYQRAEVLVSLSLYEGFGIPLLEGLFYGCKIVCSDIPVYRELYNGYASFCDPQDLRNITATLNAIGDITATADTSPLFEKYNYENSARTILGKITTS